MNKKSSKKQYNGKKQPTVVKQNKDMSLKTKNILAYILAGFILFWTIASVLGTIGFFRTSAKAEPVVDAVAQCESVVEVDDADSIAVRRRTKNKQLATAPQFQYNYIIDEGWQVNLTALRGGYFAEQAGIMAVLLSRITFKMSITPSGVMYYINNYGASTFDSSYHSIGNLTWQEGGGIELYEAFVYVDDRDFNYADVIPNRLIYYFNDDDTLDVSIQFINKDGTSTPARLSLTFDFYELGYPYFFLPSIGGTPADVGDNYTEAITYYSITEGKEMYNSGYEQGVFDSGQDYYVGYEAGKNAGYSDGYGQGYLQGSTDAGDYTFMSLISAVIDAPIQAFMGLFNFELLGVDMSAFFLSLLTVCTIIAVIKLFM